MKKEAVTSKKAPAEKGLKNEQEAYLTKRILVSAANRGFREAAKETMRVMGYNVITQDGWIVKKFADGRIERISQLEVIEMDEQIRLD